MAKSTKAKTETKVDTDAQTPIKGMLADFLHYRLMIQAYYATTTGRGIVGKATIKREYGVYLQFLECLDTAVAELDWIMQSRPDVFSNETYDAYCCIKDSMLFKEGRLDKLSDLAIAYDKIATAYTKAVKDSNITIS